MIEKNILGVVLAGGRSKRFGNDKTSAKLGDKSLIDHVVVKIEKNYNEILVISNNKNIHLKNKNIFLIEDCIKGYLGPLIGVLSAMNWIYENKKKYNWIATFPCDTPFFDESVFKIINNYKSKSNKKLFFLKSGNRRHNIFGLWSVELREVLLNDIKKGYRKVEEWANKIGCEIIEIKSDNQYSFMNINTKEDLKKAEENFK